MPVWAAGFRIQWVPKPPPLSPVELGYEIDPVVAVVRGPYGQDFGQLCHARTCG